LSTLDRVRDAFFRRSRKQVTVAVGMGIARVAGFLTGAIAARSLGPTVFGSYTIGFTVFASLMQVTSFADTWLVSRWDEDARRDAAARAVWTIKTRACTVMLVAAAGVGLFGRAALDRLGTDPASLVIGVTAAAAASLTTALASVSQARGNFAAYAVIIAVGPCVGLLLTALIALTPLRSPGIFLAAIAVSYLPTALATIRQLRRPADPSVTRTLIHNAIRFGGWVTIGSIAYVLFQRLDVFLLAALADPDRVGTYGVATRLSTVGAFLTNTITTVLMPAGSQRSTWRDPNARRAYVLESWLSILPMALALAGAIVAAPLLVTSVFGPSFAAATAATRILLFAQALLLVQMPFYFALYALEGGRWIATLGLGQLATALGTGYLLIQQLGLAGAAWSNVATYTLGLVVVAVFHWRRHTARARSS
jgi:O-antigen/teichoic acid export membrane protein